MWMFFPQPNVIGSMLDQVLSGRVEVVSRKMATGRPVATEADCNYILVGDA